MLSQQRTGCQEEDNDDLLEFILLYNKGMHNEGWLSQPPLIV